MPLPDCWAAYAHYQTYINPNVFNLFPKTIFIQVYAVLGGAGFAILGPLVGAGLLTFFTEAVTEVVQGRAEYTFMVVGALVILVVVFLPRGVLSLGEYFAKVWAWARRSGDGGGGGGRELPPGPVLEMPRVARGDGRIMTTPAGSRNGPLLRVENVSKHFGGLVAVDHLTFEVNEGEILGIIGPNGAARALFWVS